MRESIQYLDYTPSMRTFVSLLLIMVVSLAPAVVCGQTPPAQERDDVVRVRSNEVRLDVVVKDKKGRPIRDLKESDFEILEDGVAQKVESFRFVTRATTAPVTSETKDNKSGTGPGTISNPSTRSTPTVTALVFDRLSPEARALAKKAGLAYAHEGMATGGFTGVFGIDQTLLGLGCPSPDSNENPFCEVYEAKRLQ